MRQPWQTPSLRALPASAADTNTITLADNTNGLS
jgi:hypothetical protein